MKLFKAASVNSHSAFATSRPLMSRCSATNRQTVRIRPAHPVGQTAPHAADGFAHVGDEDDDDHEEHTGSEHEGQRLPYRQQRPRPRPRQTAWESGPARTCPASAGSG